LFLSSRLPVLDTFLLSNLLSDLSRLVLPNILRQNFRIVVVEGVSLVADIYKVAPLCFMNLMKTRVKMCSEQNDVDVYRKLRKLVQAFSRRDVMNLT